MGWKLDYNPEGVRLFFNSYAEKEWSRLEDSLQGRIKYAIHRHILDKHLKPGQEVLDIGCGPARFALHMAAADTRVTLADLSDKQLDLARERLQQSGLTDRIRGFHRLDVLDLSPLPEAGYDLVVCYGSVLSYTLDRHLEALRALVRVTKPGGTILVSVTGLYGTMRLIGGLDAAEFTEDPDVHLEWNGLLAGQEVVLTRQGSREFHQPMALFTSTGVKQMLSDAGLEVLDMATSNPLFSITLPLPGVTGNAVAAANAEALEVALCQCPGLLDTGEHLVAAARKP